MRRCRCSNRAPFSSTWPRNPGKLLPRAPAARYQCLQWLFFQVGGIGPMFGQLGFFHKFAGREWEDKRPRDRYVAESRRLLKVVDQHLATRAG